MANVQQALAATLRTLREQKGLTQSEVSTSLSVSQPTVANWENGRNSPTISNLYAVSKRYESTPIKVLEMSETPSMQERAKQLEQINKAKERLSANKDKSKSKKK